MHSIASIILAAGVGKRMKSDLLKVLHPVAGLPLLYYPLKLAGDLKTNPIVIVVGKNKKPIEEILLKLQFKQTQLVVQNPPLGTAHAVMTGMKKLKNFKGDILILNGDLPLMTENSLYQLIRLHHESKASLSLITAVLDDPGDYGRVLHNTSGEILGIIEAKDASEVEKGIREINVGVYLVNSSFLNEQLKDVKNTNQQGEFYLPDLVWMAVERGLTVKTLQLPHPMEGEGVNTQSELAEANRLAYRHNIKQLMDKGVRVLMPDEVYVDTQVEVGAGTTLMGPCYLTGSTRIGMNCTLEPGTILKNTVLGDRVTLKAYSYLEESQVEEGAQIGPFAHLRPETVVQSKAKVGNFVEIKKSTIGAGSKVNHLTYIGDARIGKEVNVGAGTITCNYDGVKKHPTIIEDHVFVGSDSQLVAPVRVGKGAYIGSGSTITKNVPSGSLALTRSSQVVIKNWSKKRNK